MRTLAILFAMTGFSGAATFNDPQGRYTLEAPAGWKATQLNSDAVQLMNAPAYVTVMVLPGADAGMNLDSIAKQTVGQWRGFAEAQRGETRLAGRTGRYVTYAGTNPAGADAFLEVMAIADRGSTYLLMVSAPKTQFSSFQGAFDRIEKSLTLTTRTTPSAAPRPAPAVTKTAPAAPAATGDTGYYRMKKATVIDEHGFERPLPAVSLLIPGDWQFQSSVQYGKGGGCSGNLVKVVFRATSPDGKMALELFPGKTWQWADDPNSVRLMQSSNQQMAQFGSQGCEILPPMTAGDYLKRSVLPAARAQARLTGIEPMPEIAQKVQQQVQQAQAGAARNGLQSRLRGDVGRARITYAVNGQPVEEWITAVTFANGTPGPTMNIQTGRMGQTLFYTCASEGVFGFRAPQGQLDAKEKLFMTMLSTVRIEPEWQARVFQVMNNVQAAQIKGAADRSKIIAQSNQDISKIIHDSYENKKKSDDRAAEGFSQYIRGVETYRNPSTGETLELSNQYGHAWAGSNGEYIVSDSPNFDPNVSLRGNYTRLEPVKR
jgi:hypothetical protein